MISVEEAQNLIFEQANELKSELIGLDDAYGHALKNDFYAPFSLPSFRQSAMDGYAVNLNGGKTYSVIGEVQAGSKQLYELKTGEAVRIFTGAPVPHSANSIVMQEWVERDQDQIVIAADKALLEQQHIRPIGEQLKQGDLVFKAGTTLNAATTGLLQSFGLTKVEVVRKPKVEIVVTGDELVEPGNELEYGQIYESNSVTISHVLGDKGFDPKSIHFVNDQREEVKQVISSTLEHSDVVIISGGISVGDHDHVGPVLRELGVEEVFYKVKQKPGKPMFFGKLGKKKIFALPGNPAASLSCMHMYVLPALKKMCGHKEYLPLKLNLPLLNEVRNKGDRSKLLKAKVENNAVEVLDGQASSMLHSFALANALVYLPEGDVPRNPGDLVDVILL